MNVCSKVERGGDTFTSGQTGVSEFAPNGKVKHTIVIDVNRPCQIILESTEDEMGVRRCDGKELEDAGAYPIRKIVCNGSDTRVTVTEPGMSTEVESVRTEMEKLFRRMTELKDRYAELRCPFKVDDIIQVLWGGIFLTGQGYYRVALVEGKVKVDPGIRVLWNIMVQRIRKDGKPSTASNPVSWFDEDDWDRSYTRGGAISEVRDDGYGAVLVNRKSE